MDRKWPAISFTFAVFQESRINFMLVQLRGRILPSFGSLPSFRREESLTFVSNWWNADEFDRVSMHLENRRKSYCWVDKILRY